eukprot:gene8238-8428_t
MATASGGVDNPLNERVSGISGDSYHISECDKQSFLANGFIRLPQVLTEEEMQQEVDPVAFEVSDYAAVYFKFMRGEVTVPGKDLCDMSGGQGRSPEEYTVHNVMLPRVYYPAWQGNLLEKRCQAIADQLRGGDMHVDFDMIFAKRASSEDSAFLWHQDAAYWPPLQSDTSAANCWLAVVDVDRENGCMRYVPGSHREPQLRRHKPVARNRDESHALYCPEVDETTERVVDAPARRGDVIVHHERVLHCSWPNLSNNWRHAYILNFRKAACIAEERTLGFTHSHNDEVNWDAFQQWADS